MTKFLIFLFSFLIISANAAAQDDILLEKQVVTLDSKVFIKTKKVIYLSGPIYTNSYLIFGL